jgi:capsular exopolysaccharide synthesis family protein
MKINTNINPDFFADAPKKEFDSSRFFSKILKHWPYLLLSLGIFLIAAFVYNKSTAPVYQVASKFFVKEQQIHPDILDLTGVGRTHMEAPPQKIANESIFLVSRPMAEKTIDALKMDVDYFQPGFLVDTELFKNSPIVVEVDWDHAQAVGDKIEISWSDVKTYQLKFNNSDYFKYNPSDESWEELNLSNYPTKKLNFGQWVQMPHARIKVNLVNAVPEGKINVQLRPKKELIASYTGENNIEVWPVQQMSSVLGINLTTSHPRKGSEYLNTLMELYLKEELEERNLMSKNTVHFIDQQISGISDTLSFFENRLENFRSSNRTLNISSESQTVYTEITELERQLAQEKYNNQYYRSMQQYLSREDYSQIILPSGIGIDDPVLNGLITELVTLQNEKSRLLNSQTEASPRVKDATNKIRNTHQSLAELLKNMVANSDRLVANLEQRVGRISQQFSRLPVTEQNLLKIQREFTLNESIYNFLLQRRAEAAIALASNSSFNKIVEYADPDVLPNRLRDIIVYVLAGTLGLILPVVVILLLGAIDNRIKDAKEFEELVDVPMLAKIGKAPSPYPLSLFAEPRSILAENFRFLKTNISFIAPQTSSFTLAVSSSVSSEGKTFTAINLASIYSMNNKKTVLVGCDMFKSKSLGVFNLEGKNGLSNFLSSQVDNISQVIQPTKYHNLDVVISGSLPPNPSELLGHDRFDLFLRQLKQTYDVIILDTPPVGLISQSLEIMKKVDLTLYVFRYNYSEKSFIDDLNAIKSKNGLNNLYAVLNDVDEREMVYRGYHAGYYETEKTKKTFLGNLFSRNKAAL